jgi:hypothetical protein
MAARYLVHIAATEHGPLPEKASKFLVENGRAIVYVHPYTIQKFWKKTLLDDSIVQSAHYFGNQ